MKSKFPNEEERKELQKIAESNRSGLVFPLGLLDILGTAYSFLDRYPASQIIIAVAIIPASIYRLLRLALLKRCPRCYSRGTPVPGGRRPKCGMCLEPERKEP